MGRRGRGGLFSILMGILFIIGGSGTKTKSDYPVTPVPFTAVHFDDSFWAPRIETNRTITIPFAFKQCEDTGRIANFEIAGGLKTGSFCSKNGYDDSDVYKVIEGASYALAQHPDSRLDQYLDRTFGPDKKKLILIPYYPWAHRGKGEMSDWLLRK